MYVVACVGVNTSCMKKSLCVWGCRCWCEHLLYEGICVYMGLLIAGVGMNICCMKESVCVV